MRPGQNSVLEGDEPAPGMRMVESAPGEEMAAYDSLPAIVRAAIGASPFSLSARDCLTAWLLGWKPPEIVARIEQADHELAARNSTCPEAYLPGMPLQLRARPGARRRW